MTGVSRKMSRSVIDANPSQSAARTCVPNAETRIRKFTGLEPSHPVAIYMPNTREAGGSRQHACQSASLRWRRKRGASEQAIGITKGGRNSKIHGLVDKLCRPWVLILTPGNTADCTVGPACVSLLDGIAELLGDKAYDSNSFRKSLRKDGIKPVIPGGANRNKPISP